MTIELENDKTKKLYTILRNLDFRYFLFIFVLVFWLDILERYM